MLNNLSILFFLISFTAGDTPRAATEPHAVPASEAKVTWTNEDLERLSTIPGLISIVGQETAAQETDKAVQDFGAPAPQRATEDPAWYAAQAASLHSQLEAEQSDLRDFTQALDDARGLKDTTTGVDLGGDDSGMTPEEVIDMLQDRVSETQDQLDALEDLARQNNIPPGILREQQGVPAEATGNSQTSDMEQ